MSNTVKPTISFGFAKTKPKTNLAKVETPIFKGDLKEKDEEEKAELITSIADNKINSLNKPKENNKPIVIPCQKNRDIIGSHRLKQKEVVERRLEDELLAKKDVKAEDLDAVKALIEQAKQAKLEKPDDGLIIESDKKTMTASDLETVEEANYESIDLEAFGKAALRGMGWNEKEGIGLTNKRSFQLKDVELRPKGLGLGAGFSSKKIRHEESVSNRNGTNNAPLVYTKGAYVEILSGKHENDVGQIVSFDDGLNRIMIKLGKSNETISLIQNLTRLITKSEYEKALKN